jgi:ABC-type transport system involved in multi-copper enzyme maturation permease subunit
MATTTISKSIPVPKKRSHGLTIMTRTILNSRTPLSAGIFYGVFFAILLAAIYPAVAQAHINGYLQSNVISVIIGGHISNFSGFTAFLGVELYSAIYGLLFGGIIAYIGGAAIPATIENGTLDLALSRPISRTRYYLECCLATLICGVIIGLLIVLAYLINTFGALSDKFNWLLKIGPFYYAPATDLLVNHQLTWWYPWVLVVAGLIFGIIGLVVFNKRDLPAV